MTHVALFTDSYGKTRNGVTVAVQLLREQLLALGHEVTVVAPGGRRMTVRAAMTGGTEFLLGSLRLPGVHPRVATGLGFRSCLHVLCQTAPDVVHVHGFGPVSLLGVHFARRTNTPLLISWHTDVAAYFRHYRYLLPLLFLWEVAVCTVCGERKGRHSSIRRRATDRLTASLVSTADLVLAPSEKITRKLRELSSEIPIVTLPIGLDPIVPSVATSLSLPEIAGTVLLYVGRVAPEKGISLLLDAFEILRGWRSDVTLVLAGDYSCARGLKRRLRTARQRGVILTGELERGDLVTLYARAELFVFPSLTDTQGLVLQEATHAGLPLVVVDSELQVPITDGQTVNYCEPIPRSLAAAMARTLDLKQDTRWRVAADEAAKALASHNSSARYGREIIALYRRTQESVYDG